MKTQYFALAIALILVVSVSGCIEGFEGFEGIFGTSQPTVEKTPDIIVTEGIKSIPASDIFSEDTFTVTYILKNQDDLEELNDVKIILYNWGICEPQPADFFPDTWIPQANYYEYTFQYMGPGQSERIEWDFKAPTNEKMSSIEVDCPIKWEIAYTYTSKSQDDFTVISKDRLSELQRAGESWSGTNQPQYVGSGPIKIYYDFRTEIPGKDSSAIQFSLTVIDKGRGLYPNIKQGSMELSVPKEWTTGLDAADLANPCSGKFEYKEEKEGTVIYKSKIKIPMNDRETAPILCKFRAPALTIPEKTYNVYASINDYEYKLSAEKTVHIKPLIN